jgi:hypothetical protein
MPQTRPLHDISSAKSGIAAEDTIAPESGKRGVAPRRAQRDRGRALRDAKRRRTARAGQKEAPLTPTVSPRGEGAEDLTPDAAAARVPAS